MRLDGLKLMVVDAVVVPVTVNVTGTVTDGVPVALKCDYAIVGAGRKEAGCYAYGHGASANARAWSVRQPGGVMTDAPV